MDNLKKSLMDYGVWILRRQLGVSIENEPYDTDEPSICAARDAVGDLSIDPKISSSPVPLRNIFSFVSARGQDSGFQHPDSLPLKPLAMDLSDLTAEAPEAIWESFQSEFKRVPMGAGTFETFMGLYRKYAWYIPSALHMAGISLFEQFKIVAALSHCYERGGANLLLVGGDLPGIQAMLYTITSKGAAKSLRGRSFYLQLLCDILMRATLRELSLPTANVIYSAGGNFRILSSARDMAALQALRNEINSRLLDAHGGSLFSAMDWVELNMCQVVDGNAFSAKMGILAEKMGRQKRSWFAEQAKHGRYEDVFGLRGRGGHVSAETPNYCEICQVDVEENSSVVKEEDDATTVKCEQCDSFESMTRDMLGKDYFLVEDQVLGSLSRVPQLREVSDKYQSGYTGRASWYDVIKTLGYGCSFNEDTPTSGGQLSVYRINSCDFLPRELNPRWSYGFRFLGNVTPTTGSDIRSTTEMAKLDSTGIDRYGILRMDVDWLGDVFSKRLTNPDVLHTSALSASLSLFFEGWLNCICQSVAQNWAQEAAKVTGDTEGREKLPYIIYSGGDDLFILGTWDVMPLLAERIRNDFASYVTTGRISTEPPVAPPHLTISAGISLFPAKFPIYQAAELAKEALDDRAKGRVSRNDEPLKDAVDFLGLTVGWEDFGHVKHMAFELANMISCEGAPHSLLTMLKEVADSYSKSAKGASPGHIVYGKWMWLLAYSLCRLKERIKDDGLRERVMKIGGDALDLGKSKDAARWRTINHLSLPVRWAEFLIRKGE